MNKARLRFMGTGTSQGVPIIGCRCEKCVSEDPRDKRFRASALVEYGGMTILVDAGPDFRSQMIAAGVRHLDAILLTHNHKDHTGGLDDVRALNYVDRKVVEIYCEDSVLTALKKEYDYAFCQDKYPGSPEWHVHLIDESPFIIHPESGQKELAWVRGVGYRYQLDNGEYIPTGNPLDEAEKAVDENFSGEMRGSDGRGVEIIPIRGFHDTLPVLGFRFGNIAYITDMSRLPDSELKKLQGLDHITLNTVGYRLHHSHFSLDQALELADKIAAKHTWLTHLSHTFPRHMDFCRKLESLCAQRQIHSIVQPAYDGLVIE